MSLSRFSYEYRNFQRKNTKKAQKNINNIPETALFALILNTETLKKYYKQSQNKHITAGGCDVFIIGY
jgi:hypothetical protein